MDKNDIIGAGQLATGGYLVYQGIKHGLPRVAGIRIEYHTTSKENAGAIKNSGNILDPKFGGKNGWSEKVKPHKYIKNSEGFIHITGLHKDCQLPFGRFIDKYSFLKVPMRTIQRIFQNLMYKTGGNIGFDELKKGISTGTIKDKLKWGSKKFPRIVRNEKTDKFCIPGIDSYFNREFLPDTDDIALKSTKPIKVYNNRFSAMLAGLKKFGLKGIKENKGRVAFGVGIVSLGLYSAVKLIKKGITNILK